MAICVSLGDVTDRLNISLRADPEYTGGIASLPIGLSLDTASNEVTMTSYTVSTPSTPPPTLSFTNQTDLLDTALLDVFIIYSSRSIPSGFFQAVEVLFYFCVESYNVTTVNGSSSTDLIASTPPSNVNFSVIPDKDAEGIIFPDPQVNFTGPDQQNYNFDYRTLFQIYRAIAPFFSGDDNSPLGYALSFLPPFGNGTTITDAEDAETRQSIQNLMQNIAISITNVSVAFSVCFILLIQLHRGKGVTNIRLYRLRSAGTLQSGTTLKIQNTITVRWGYLAFPATQVALSSIFFLWIIAKSTQRKIPFLKDSILGTIFALDTEDKAVLEAEIREATESSRGIGNRIEAITRVAEGSRVKLTERGKSWSLNIA
jgi:hypothetical protein